MLTVSEEYGGWLKDEDVQQLSALVGLERLDVSYTRARAPPPLPSLTDLAMDLCEVLAERTRCSLFHALALDLSLPSQLVVMQVEWPYQCVTN